MHGTAKGLWALGVGLTLAACGGSDGDAPSSPPIQLAAITSANAQPIASAVLVAAFESGELSGLAIGGSSPFGTGKAAPGAFFKQNPQRHIRVQVPVGPETVACDVGGSFTMTGDIADPMTLSAGDRITLDYDACDDGVSVTDGVFSFTITSFSGDLASGLFALGIRVDLTAFQAVTAGETVTADGDISVVLDTRTSPMLTVALAASSFSVGSDGASHALTEFEATQTINEATTEFTFDTAGTLTSSAFNGAVNFDTTETFVGTGVDYPAIGEMLITGADNGTIRVIALDNVFVRLEVDSNGDGTLDAVIDTTWEALR
jgi:hypothetical protein